MTRPPPSAPRMAAASIPAVWRPISWLWIIRCWTTGYAETPEAQWLLEHAADYGFILRYPKEKEEITGIIWEPWHFRYVGVENAAKIKESGLCLEEYLGAA